ncbi:hypothetical protein GCM10023085_54440 [Actinomadura viridis]
MRVQDLTNLRHVPVPLKPSKHDLPPPTGLVAHSQRGVSAAALRPNLRAIVKVLSLCPWALGISDSVSRSGVSGAGSLNENWPRLPEYPSRSSGN